MTTDPIPTTTDDLLLEDIMPAYARPIRAADADYQDRLDRGEERFAAAQERASDIWLDDKAIVVALDDYCLTADDVKAIAALRRLAFAGPISPAVFQQAILTALAGMNERVIEYAQDLIEIEERFS